MVKYIIRDKEILIMLNKLVRKFAVFITYIYYNIKYRIKGVGIENVPESGGVIICANHRKAEDPILLYHAYKKRWINFFAKKALTDSKFKNWLICDVCGVKAVQHSGADISAVKWGVSKLKGGEVVGIFPEGTRNRTDADLLELEHGAAFIAHMSKAKVVTATINCSRKFFSKCEVIFSRPLELEEFYSERLNDDVKMQITQKIKESILKSLKK